MFIALHSVGMIFVVGLSLIIVLRNLGFLEDVSLAIIRKLITVAWFGFLLNLVTGIFVLMSRVSEYLFVPTFLINIGYVALVFGDRVWQNDYDFCIKRLNNNSAIYYFKLGN